MLFRHRSIVDDAVQSCSVDQYGDALRLTLSERGGGGGAVGNSPDPRRFPPDADGKLFSTPATRRVHCRHGTGSHFVTQRPSDPGIQRPGDPVNPVTLFYNELQMSTYVADKRLQWARGLPVFIAVWRLHASGK